MPILWRYALQTYLRIFGSCIISFIALLIIARFKELARFTALSGDFSMATVFLLYQIPFILPIAIPVASFVATYLLTHDFELNAMRASGLSLKMIFAPILFLAVVFSFLNFFLCAEIAPFCRRESKELLYSQTSKNPLFLLQRQKLIPLKHAYLDMKVKSEEEIENLVCVFNNGQQLHYISAEKLALREAKLKGENVAFMTYGDVLSIENQKEMCMPAKILSQSMKKKHPHLDLQGHSLKMLLIKMGRSDLNEILRRISLSLAPFSLSLLGLTLGLKKTKWFIPGFLALSLFMSFASNIFLISHFFIWGFTWFRCALVARGIV